MINPSSIGNTKKFIAKNIDQATYFGEGYYHTWYIIEADGFCMVFRRGKFSDHNVTYPVCWVEKSDADYVKGQMQGFVDRDVF